MFAINDVENPERWNDFLEVIKFYQFGLLNTNCFLSFFPGLTRLNPKATFTFPNFKVVIKMNE